MTVQLKTNLIELLCNHCSSLDDIKKAPPMCETDESWLYLFSLESLILLWQPIYLSFHLLSYVESRKSVLAPFTYSIGLMIH